MDLSSLRLRYIILSRKGFNDFRTEDLANLYSYLLYGVVRGDSLILLRADKTSYNNADLSLNMFNYHSVVSYHGIGLDTQYVNELSRLAIGDRGYEAMFGVACRVGFIDTKAFYKVFKSVDLYLKYFGNIYLPNSDTKASFYKSLLKYIFRGYEFSGNILDIISSYLDACGGRKPSPLKAFSGFLNIKVHKDFDISSIVISDSDIDAYLDEVILLYVKFERYKPLQDYAKVLLDRAFSTNSAYLRLLRERTNVCYIAYGSDCVEISVG